MNWCSWTSTGLPHSRPQITSTISNNVVARIIRLVGTYSFSTKYNKHRDTYTRKEMKKMLHLHSFPFFFLVPVILSTPYSDKNAILRTTFIKLGSSPFSPSFFCTYSQVSEQAFFHYLLIQAKQKQDANQNIRSSSKTLPYTIIEERKKNTSWLNWGQYQQWWWLNEKANTEIMHLH